MRSIGGWGVGYGASHRRNEGECAYGKAVGGWGGNDTALNHPNPQKTFPQGPPHSNLSYHPPPFKNRSAAPWPAA